MQLSLHRFVCVCVHYHNKTSIYDTSLFLLFFRLFVCNTLLCADASVGVYVCVCVCFGSDPIRSMSASASAATATASGSGSDSKPQSKDASSNASLLTVQASVNEAKALNEYLAFSRKRFLHYNQSITATAPAATAPAATAPAATATAAPIPTVHLVMGNEAGDTDSIVSAIVYAYFQHTLVTASAPAHTTTTTHNHSHSHSHQSHSHSHSHSHNPKAGGAASAGAVGAAAAGAVEWLPVINIPRQYLALRLDTEWLLKTLNVDAKNLTFIDEVCVCACACVCFVCGCVCAILIGDGLCDLTLCCVQIDLGGLVKAGSGSGSGGSSFKLELCLVDHNLLTEAQHAVAATAVTRIVDHHSDAQRYTTTVPTAHRTIQVVGSW